jgi:hypothetical protein
MGSSQRGADKLWAWPWAGYSGARQLEVSLKAVGQATADLQEIWVELAPHSHWWVGNHKYHKYCCTEVVTALQFHFMIRLASTITPTLCLSLH